MFRRHIALGKWWSTWQLLSRFVDEQVSWLAVIAKGANKSFEVFDWINYVFLALHPVKIPLHIRFNPIEQKLNRKVSLQTLEGYVFQKCFLISLYPICWMMSCLPFFARNHANNYPEHVTAIWLLQPLDTDHRLPCWCAIGPNSVEKQAGLASTCHRHFPWENPFFQATSLLGSHFW